MAATRAGADEAPQPLDEREMAAWHALIRAHSRVVRRLEAELEAEHGLSLPAYEVLAHLSDAPNRQLRMSELAHHAVLTPSGLTRLVDKLCRDGLLERRRCGADARVVYATLTPKGMRRLEAAYPAHLRGVREHYLDWMTSEQHDSVADALGALAGALKTDCQAAEVQAAAQAAEAACGEADVAAEQESARAEPAARR